MRRYILQKGPAKVRLIGIKRVTVKSGQTYIYVRRSDGPDIRLPDLPMHHPDFLNAYTAAREAPRDIQRGNKAGSIAALFTACLASEDMHIISPAYRAMIRRHADDIRRDYGAAPYAGLERRHIQQDVDAASAPDHRRKVWRFTFRWALRNGLIARDPSEGVSLPRRPPSDGHPAWDADDVNAFRARWPLGAPARLIMEVLQWSGARISDAVSIGPQHVGIDGVIAYKQQKTRGMAFCPWTCALPAYAARMQPDRDQMHTALAARATINLTFLATAQGRTRSSKAIGGMIREAAQAAGIQKSAHGLRKYRATQLADAGATPHQIGAWTGHESLKEIERYTKTMDRRAAVTGTPPEHKTGKTSGLLPKAAKI